jgi:hypothetical protein
MHDQATSRRLCALLGQSIAGHLKRKYTVLQGYRARPLGAVQAVQQTASFIYELINQCLAALLRYKVLLVSQMHGAIDNAITGRASPRRSGPVPCLSRISTQVREFS